MKFRFATDSESGGIDAATFDKACEKLRDMVPSEAIADGDRFEIGGDRKQQLRDAAERSVSHNQIVRVESPDIFDDMRKLEAIAEERNCEFAYVVNGEVTETWAYEAETQDGEMVWRVHLLSVG